MAKGKRKGNCPRCGVRMKLRQRYCTNCGNGNPLLVAPRRRSAPAPAGPAAVKSAGGGYAPVVAMRQAVPSRDPRWTDALRESDPGRRVEAVELILKGDGVA